MAAVAWTLQSGDTTQSLEAWGLSKLTRRRVSQALDTCTFHHEAAEGDSTPLFAAKSLLTIYRDEVPWFYGRVGANPRTLDPTAEGIGYVIEGPWSWLERTAFMQEWRYIPTALATVANLNKTRVILGQELGTVGGSWTRFTVEDQLAEI